MARAARQIGAWATGTGSAFGGAASNRLTLDWVKRPVAADKELSGALPALKARARDLVRNDAQATQALRLYADNVVGPDGVTLQSKVINNRGRLEDEVNGLVEAKWRDWGRAATCTVNGRHSWVDVQRLVMQLVQGEGEALVRMLAADNDYGFALQLLDSDLLDDQYSRPAGNGQAEIRMSVELDDMERPVAYHFLRSHPDALNAGRADRATAPRIRVPAAEVIHLYHATRLGQSRGVTAFAPVMYNLRMLQGYQEAYVVAARQAASAIGFIKTDAEAMGTVDGDAPANEPMTTDVEPGSFGMLLPGQSIETWNPNVPKQEYRDFVKSVIQSTASGLGLSYASLSGDLEGTSYASGRTGLLQERDHYRAMQAWLVEHLHRRVFAEWLRHATLAGALGLEDSKRRAVEMSATWQPRGWQWVDPRNDVEASILEIKHGLNTRQAILAAKGQDFEDIAIGLAQEDAIADEHDITVTDAPEPAPAPAAAPPASNAAGEGRAVTVNVPAAVPPAVNVHVPPAPKAAREFVLVKDADGEIVGWRTVDPEVRSA